MLFTAAWADIEPQKSSFVGININLTVCVRIKHRVIFTPISWTWIDDLY